MKKTRTKLQYIEKTLPRAPWKHTPLSSMIYGEFKIRGGIFFLYSIQVLERAGLCQWTVYQPVTAYSKYPRLRGLCANIFSHGLHPLTSSLTHHHSKGDVYFKDTSVMWVDIPNSRSLMPMQLSSRSSTFLVARSSNSFCWQSRRENAQVSVEIQGCSHSEYGDINSVRAHLLMPRAIVYYLS